MSQVDVIAIDGPVASGKGSVSSGVAKALDFHVLDSGALYRLTALACMNQCVDLGDAAAAEKVAQSLNPLFKDGKIYLEGKDVTDAIRTEEVGLNASKIAAYPGVRKALFELQRRSAVAPGLVASGWSRGCRSYRRYRLPVIPGAMPASDPAFTAASCFILWPGLWAIRFRFLPYSFGLIILYHKWDVSQDFGS